MSRSTAEQFFRHLEDNSQSREALSNTPSLVDIIALAKSVGFDISESDLRSALNHMILNAHTLPRPWGRGIARELGLVRS